MEISYISEFVVLAERMNYLAAAEELYLSQSTLSRHIQSMENELGVQLFDRTTRKVRLSNFGRSFLPYARQIAGARTNYLQMLHEEKRILDGSITVGMIPIMRKQGISEILARFQEEYPEISVNTAEADSAELIEMLRNGLCDFAFLRVNNAGGSNTKREMKDGDMRFSLLPFSEDRMAALLPETHPLAKEERVSMKQLKNEIFLLSKSVQSLAPEACRAAGYEPQVVLARQPIHIIEDLVGKGWGVGLFTKKPAESYLEFQNVKLIDIDPPVLTSIYLAFREERSIKLPAMKFLKFYRTLHEPF